MTQRDLQRQIQRLVDSGQAKTQAYSPHEPRASKSGRRVEQSPRSTGEAGIASPITEEDEDFAKREWHDQAWISNDGLLSFPAAKKIHMKDANLREVVFEYHEPPTDAEQTSG